MANLSPGLSARTTAANPWLSGNAEFLGTTKAN
jgi:hypothetical protein